MTVAVLMQVLTAGQELVFDYQGDMFILRPLSMMIAASQDKSAQQGLLTDTTAMTFEAAPGNYGKAAPLAVIAEGLKVQHIPVCSSDARVLLAGQMRGGCCCATYIRIRHVMSLHQEPSRIWHRRQFSAVPDVRVCLDRRGAMSVVPMLAPVSITVGEWWLLLAVWG